MSQQGSTPYPHQLQPQRLSRFVQLQALAPWEMVVINDSRWWRDQQAHRKYAPGPGAAHWFSFSLFFVVCSTSSYPSVRIFTSVIIIGSSQNISRRHIQLVMFGQALSGHINRTFIAHRQAEKSIIGTMEICTVDTGNTRGTSKYSRQLVIVSNNFASILNVLYLLDSPPSYQSNNTMYICNSKSRL